jgi:hypothetical protein
MWPHGIGVCADTTLDNQPEDMVMDHSVADARVAMENQNRTITVGAQMSILRVCIEAGAPMENLLGAMENLCKR